MKRHVLTLEDGMQYHHTTVDDVLYIYNPWSGALLMTIRRITQDAAMHTMHALNTGIRHIHSEWAWHGNYGVYYPVIK